MSNVFATAAADFAASVLGSPPAYTIATEPPKLNVSSTAPTKNLSPTDTNTTSNVLPKVKITQHSCAYALQLYLRLADVPHTVVNTPYHRFSDGAAYPTLHTSSPSLNIMVPSPLPGGGGALSYLKETQPPPPTSTSPPSLPLPPPLLQLIKLKGLHAADSPPPHNFNDELVLTNLIQTNLAPLLLALEFADEDIGYRVTKSRWATQLPHLPVPFNAISIFYHISDSLRIWAEKVSVLRSLGIGGVVPLRRKGGVGLLAGGSSVHLDVGETIKRAAAIYEAINEKILESSGAAYIGGYLLGDSPSPVDCLLFGHVTQALANPHLAKILGNFPALLKWFVDIVQRSKLAEDLTLNDQVNRMNQHDTLPATHKFALKLLELSKRARGGGEVEIEDIDTVIATAHAKDMAVRRSLITLHRLRFGGALVPDSKVGKPTDATQQNEAMRQVKEANKLDNQMWIGGVGVLATGFLLYGAHGIKLET
ncbi:hypothetical protein TrST_g5955 [Triparma strigata]|uniref:GST C-terminal domain-containing protein n=1 Tax=Triparma strigata TaxID=1606541 RepID=A0A9W7C2F0_9STRA|nr:hypothetical protein TrST_g5955 [Triparma strigata]